MTRQEIARTALRAAIELRRKAKVPLEDPICVYDFAETLEVEVRFVGGSSFAGMFAKGMNAVFVPSERPAGRRAFTCAHELAPGALVMVREWKPWILIAMTVMCPRRFLPITLRDSC